MRLYLLMICVALLSACGSQEESELVRLEREVEAQPTNANVSELLTWYGNWLSEHREVNPERKEILLKTLALSDRHIRLNTKLNALQALVLDYPADPETSGRLLEMGEIFEMMQKDQAAMILRQAVLQRWPNVPAADSIRMQIPPDALPVDSAIAKLGRDMFDDSQFRLNERIARQYVDACETYALVHHDDPQSAEYLHKAAETARTLRTIPKALAIYDWILQRYPDHPRASQALFLKAFTYDNNLQDTANAARYYREFLAAYPGDDFAESAQFLLDNLGKDDDELLQVLQQKAQEGQ
ncbi:MAG: tetratricopeptide repeat protein [Saprospiraceae bacterium]|nr:tetratricopeptide repeat protein [Saprospiraceae bacterium]